MNNGCRDFYLGIYGGLGLMQAFSILILSVTLSITTLAGSRKLHRVLLDRVLKSPMGFFDTTPLGRIVNRYCTTQNSQNKWTKISGLETNIFELKMMGKSGLDFFFEILLAPLQLLLHSAKKLPQKAEGGFICTFSLLISTSPSRDTC